jgi:hypothetical protein
MYFRRWRGDTRSKTEDHTHRLAASSSISVAVLYKFVCMGAIAAARLPIQPLLKSSRDSAADFRAASDERMMLLASLMLTCPDTDALTG